MLTFGRAAHGSSVLTHSKPVHPRGSASLPPTFAYRRDSISKLDLRLRGGYQCSLLRDHERIEQTNGVKERRKKIEAHVLAFDYVFDDEVEILFQARPRRLDFSQSPGAISRNVGNARQRGGQNPGDFNLTIP